MFEFKKLRLAQFTEVTTGATPKSGQEDSWGDELPFITPSDQSETRREATPTRFLSSIGVTRLQNRVVPPGSTNLTCIGSTIGKVSMADSYSVTNQQINTLTAKQGLANSGFVYYLIKNWSGTLKQFAAGSATPIINKTTLANFEFFVPPLKVQSAIAAVLSALDDKIAANTKISHTSNELASTLFRQALSMAEFSDDTFDDLALVSGGGTPSTKNPDYWDGNIPWATPSDITALMGPYLKETSRAISDAGLKSCASDLYPKGSILMTSRATIGAFAITQKPTAVNQGFIVVQPNDPELRYWFFHEMQSRVDEFISLANGATFLELSRGNFKKFKVRKASTAVMYEFNKQALALHESAQSVLAENALLSATRDALLPQLMSGMLGVKDAETVVESVV